MEIALVVSLAVALVVVLAVCGWLLRERGRLAAEKELAQARQSDLETTRTTFQALAGEALRNSNEEFMRLAQTAFALQRTEATAELERRRLAVDQLIAPVAKALEKTHQSLEQVGRDHAGLREQVLKMSQSNSELRSETSKLVQALRKPNVRGRYGEVQLERVVEVAGMKSYCDFTLQSSQRDEEGKLSRPDLVVRLPNGRVVAIDAKMNVDAYLDALDAKTPEEAEAHLERYAENVMLQAQKLARKSYWTSFDASPEFVVMFIPGDQLVDAALERRPELIEYAAERNVVIASPATLIGLLRAVHVGWREKNLSDSAQELFALGRELHQRAAIVLEHAAVVGESIERARKSYNDFVGSIHSRLIPTLRRFEERDARSSKDLPELRAVEGETRRPEPLLPLGEPGEPLDVKSLTPRRSAEAEALAKARDAPAQRP
ncbi:MAG: DNA recombination protein RmuC [Planctomycetes bacterium]|nr:DNA recombination protein RmuC [Planctomycetota bacterium]